MSAPVPNPASADRNLLFGILALQMDFVTRDQLVAAMHAWVLAKAKPLGEILQEQGALRADSRSVLELLVQKHLELHGNEPEQSLAAVGSVDALRQVLHQIADPDVQASLARVPAATAPADPNLTQSFAAGQQTKAGARFRILRFHDRGGLGEVYVARDQELGREVALKEIQAQHATDAESRARFVLEAQITGGLEHPGIVPVYGLGAYADGRPFYAMRFIKGDSLKEAIRRFHEPSRSGRHDEERTVALRQLLRRLQDVCHALQYAHDRGVLHRDLKPSNIMLGKYGETLVVDWGLAKAVGRSEAASSAATECSEPPLRPAAGSSVEPTQMGARLGTLAYMSPEQAAGRLDQLGPASDVYSLGATLYCLLTGQPPIADKDAAALLAKLERGDFPRPREVTPAVPVPLEAICLKALALRPLDRYASAGELGRDIERWLDDQPVRAWPEPWTVRTWRWVRRHRTLVTASASAVAVALVCLGVLTVFLLSAAEQQALRRQHLNQLVRAALDKVVEERKDLHDRLKDPQRVQELLSDIDLWQALVQGALADLERARGLAQGERELLDEDLAGELAALEQALAADRRDAQLAKELDDIRLEGATLSEGKWEPSRGVQKYAAVFARAGIAVTEREPAEVARLIVGTPVQYAVVAALDQWANATADPQLLPRLLAVTRQVDPHPWRDRFRDPQDRVDRRALEQLARDVRPDEQSPQVLNALAAQLHAQGGDPLEVMQRALRYHPRDFWLYFDAGCYAKEPVEKEGRFQAALALRPRSAAAHNNLGNALRNKKDLEGAIAHYRQALAIDPRFGWAHGNLGEALRDKQDVAGAIAHYQKALDLDPKDAKAHCAFGHALLDKQDVAGAIAHYQKALDLDPMDGAAHNNLGNALWGKKDLAGAIVHYQKALEIDPKCAAAYNGLGNALWGKKDLAGAIAHYQKALEIDPKCAAAHIGFGIALRDKQDVAGAIAHYQKALELDPKCAAAHNSLGNALRAKQDVAGALVHFQKALDLDPKYAMAHYNLGAIHCDVKRDYDGAIAFFHKALELDPKISFSHNGLGNALRAKQDVAGAIAHYQKALDLDPKLVEANFGLGQTLNAKRDVAGAIAHYQKALDLDPKHAKAHNNLGAILCDVKHDYDRAITCFRKAITLDPQDAVAHSNLGFALLKQGQFAEARKANLQCLQLTPANHPSRAEVQQRLQQCEQLLDLDRQLLAFLDDGAAPKGVSEQLALADLCVNYKRYQATATRLYADAFASRPALADDLDKGHRYQAACAAVLAAAGQSRETKALDATEQSTLRARALAWLRADLDVLTKRSRANQSEVILLLLEKLPQWQQEPALASVRDAKGLAALPAAELTAWRLLWTDAEQRLREVRARFPESTLQGTLTEQQRAQSHELNMAAGKTYILDMHSSVLDCYLKLYDDRGKLLAENDDVAENNQDARLVFTPPAAGTFRIEATSFEQSGRGAYTLTIRAISGTPK